MRKVEKKWGYEIIFAETKDYVGKILQINAGQRLSLQYHEVKEETVYVQSGVLYLYDAEGGIEKLYPGEAFHVKPMQIHRFGAGEGAVRLVEVSTAHLDDVIRLEDDYGRV